MKIKKDGSVEKIMLEVTMKLVKGKKVIDWNYGDRPNCYFLIGVLDVIKAELINEIEEATDEEIGE